MCIPMEIADEALVHAHDPKAFVIIGDIRKCREGFKSIEHT